MKTTGKYISLPGEWTRAFPALCQGTVAALAACAACYAQVSEPMDIAPFALPNTPANEIRFEEPRDIVAVVIGFRTAVPEDLGLSYLHKTWPEVRIEERSKGHEGGFGWIHQDDWFNVEWQQAAISSTKIDETHVRIEFHGLTAEFPNANDYDVLFRRTLGLRADGVDPDDVVSWQVFTASAQVVQRLAVQLDAGAPTPGNRIRLSGYNLHIDGIEETQGVSAQDAENIVVNPGDSRGFIVVVRHMLPAHDYCNDDGLLTFHLEHEAFTVSLVSLAKQGPIWFEDLGFFICDAQTPVSLDQYHQANGGAQTISEQVRNHPENSYGIAFFGQPRSHATSYVIGCPRARQRVRIEANGDLLIEKRSVTWTPGKDTERFKCAGAARFFFGFEDWQMLGRYPDPEPALVYNLSFRKEGMRVDQRAFMVPLMTPVKEDSWTGDDTMVALVKFTFTNEGSTPALAMLPVQYSQSSTRSTDGLGQHPGYDDYLVPMSEMDDLALEENRIMSPWEEQPVVRCLARSSMQGNERDKKVVFSKELAPGKACEFVLLVPYIALESEEEFKRLSSLDFDACHREISAYWRKVGTQGAYVRTPVTQLNALHMSHLAHVLITDFEMPDGSGLINTSVGTSTYGNFTNESCMIVHDLDERSLHEEARKRLNLWIKYQGTAPQPGNFTDYDGMYFGAGGFEQGSYNQHHAWVLWALSEHYLFTRDDAWFQDIAASLIAGADWVFRQRRNTMTQLPHSRGWEYGFLPAGSLEDVTDFYYWLSTNALTWRGTEWTARALEAASHPEAGRVRRESDAYRADLTKGFETMRAHSPLVRLRDGRWIPYYPSRIYCRGREVGWIREVLEGSVYLLISGLYDADSRAAEWILDDFQDNRYTNPPYGYEVPSFQKTWFHRGGISMQPNLLAGLLPYLDRDEPDIYTWMFFNAWVSCYREELNAMVEHPLPVLGFSNHAHYKTSDESNATAWLRYMFVHPSDDGLFIGRALPRSWFSGPEPIEVRDVATRYGKVSVCYEPDPAAGSVKATVCLPLTEAPKSITIRFRHPEGAAIQKVSVNGAPYERFNPEKGDVDLTGMTGTLEVVAEY